MTLLLLLACKGDTGNNVGDDSSTPSDDSGVGDDSGDDTGVEIPPSTAEGNIDLRDGTQFGTVKIEKAFVYFSDVATLVVASSNPAATCALVEQLYDPEKKEPVDRTDLHQDGGCNLAISLTGMPDIEAYDLQVDTGAVVNAQCNFGDGDWEQKGGSDAGYYWSGPYFEAAAWKGNFSATVDDVPTRRVKVTVDLREWEGTFPYNGPSGKHKASGKVQGDIQATWCEGMGKLGIF